MGRDKVPDVSRQYAFSLLFHEFPNQTKPAPSYQLPTLTLQFTIVSNDIENHTKRKVYGFWAVVRIYLDQCNQNAC